MVLDFVWGEPGARVLRAATKDRGSRNGEPRLHCVNRYDFQRGLLTACRLHAFTICEYAPEQRRVRTPMTLRREEKWHRSVSRNVAGISRNDKPVNARSNASGRKRMS